MKKTSKQTIQRETTADGLMTFGRYDNGLRFMDFECCEDVDVEAMIARCRVQVMRDGNVYMTQLPKRHRNRPIFRENDSSLSLGRNHRWYFVLTLDEDQLEQLPQKLVQQASAIAQKVLLELIKGRGYRL